MWYIMMDIIYISHHQYIQYISIYLYYINIYGAGPLLVQGLRSNLHGLLGTAHGVGAVIPRDAPGDGVAWRKRGTETGSMGIFHGENGGFSGLPPLEKCSFFFGRKIMGRVERSMTNHIFMQHSWYNQQYGSLIRFNRDNIEIIANNIHGFRQSPNQKGGFN